MASLGGIERKRLWVLFTCCAASGALLWIAVRYHAVKKPDAPPFRFPTQELAALDRDLQARFAVVPDKDFGITRTYGNQHYLYNPQSGREQATISALKKKNTDVAFYLMSRALWLRSWDGSGYKPIQGPVHVTGKITLPLPRIVNFEPNDYKIAVPIIDQEKAQSHDSLSTGGDLPTYNPAGTPISSPTPPPEVPSVNSLQAIGNRVFALAEDAPHSAKIGVSQKVNNRWKVVAVPIRASQTKCVSCHIYEPQKRNPDATTRTTIEVGDALGVAFYLYSVEEKKQERAQAVRGANAIKESHMAH